MSYLAIPKSAEKPEHPYGKYTNSGKMTGGMPLHYFCRGCGYGAIGQAITRVFVDENIDAKKFPFVVNVGCYSQLPVILPGDCLMSLHGRGLPVATGIKLSNPELKPISIHGDGDLLSIGTNHFVHACRRNIDVVIILLNNKVYGMTGGQVAPTTPTTFKATTAPYGYEEPPMDSVKVAMACGASYVARWTTNALRQFMKSFKEALLEHKGVSFIEVVSQCVTYFGRKNKMGEPIQTFKFIKDNTVTIKQAESMSEEELVNKWVIGVHRRETRPELSDIKFDMIKKYGVKK
ncbi:MAG: thiamine pyrophosphate-dependent enzyme [Candidatus Helarchaeota archaeon]